MRRSDHVTLAATLLALAAPVPALANGRTLSDTFNDYSLRRVDDLTTRFNRAADHGTGRPADPPPSPELIVPPPRAAFDGPTGPGGLSTTVRPADVPSQTLPPLPPGPGIR